MQTFDIQKHSVSFIGQTLVQYGPDTVIKASYLEDAFTFQPSNSGGGVRSLNPNVSGEVEVTLLVASPSNDVLNAFAIADRLRGEGVGPILVKDGSGSARCSGQNAWIKKVPDMERGKEAGVVTWVFTIEKMKLEQGGTTDVQTGG